MTLNKEIKPKQTGIDMTLKHPFKQPLHTRLFGRSMPLNFHSSESKNICNHLHNISVTLMNLFREGTSISALEMGIAS